MSYVQKTAFALAFFVAFFIEKAAAQNGEKLFDDSVLHEIRFEMDLGENWLDTLFADYSAANKDPENVPEKYRKAASVRIDGQPLAPIGVRMRGNSSVIFNRQRGFKKLPLKLDFDRFFDQKFDGLQTINLNNNTNDPTFQRDATAYAMLREAGQAAPRTAFAKIFINGSYFGLYSMVENADKTFLKRHFGGAGNDGNLYRCTTGNLGWLGDSAAAYRKSYELKTNEKAPDWSRLIEWLRVINFTPPDSMIERLGGIFDIENYLRVAAIERLVQSWDSYTWTGLNFNVYEREDGKIQWIPWDYNETFQFADPFWKASYLVPRVHRPFTKAVFSQPIWRRRYLEIVCEMLQNGSFSIEKWLPRIRRQHDLIREAYRDDPNPLFTFAAFEANLTDPVREHFDYPATGFSVRFAAYDGLLEFIEKRREWTREQFRLNDFECDFSEKSQAIERLKVSPNPARAGDEIRLSNSKIETETHSKILVFDARGRLVQAGDWAFWPDGAAFLTLENLPRGLYFLQKSEADGRRAAGKLVVD